MTALRPGPPSGARTPSVVAIVGPTATGKSDLALDLAEHLGTEIVNADAMQLYRGMDIGTAKVPPAHRRGITHHQLDVLEVTEEASVAAYQKYARANVQDILTRRGSAVVVGGSGLYVRALLDQINFPGTDPQVRRRWQERADAEGPGALYQELQRRDPQAAERINSGNTRRIVRALEVIEITGQPFSANLPGHTYHLPALQIGLDLPDEKLDARIGARAQGMFAAGLAEEAAGLREQGLERGKTAARAVGYPQALALLRGECSQSDAVESTALATRQLVRRQRKWFRRDPRITWLDPGDVTAQARRLIE